ncbi:MAG: hypothetical protein WBQ76_04440 [Candidatus Korobacteraceae bacterium]
MLKLADTSIRMYRRKDGRVSLRLKSYLLVHSNVSFRLCAYLRSISCHLTFASGKEIEFDEVAYSEATEAEYKLDTMVHGFRASAVTDIDTIRNTIATFRMDYSFSFTGHEDEITGSFQAVVPLVKRSTVYGKW